MNTKTLAGFGIGLVSGVVIGGVIALLYAPQSGKRTRQLIRDTATDGMDTFKQKAGAMIDMVGDAASEANRKGHAAIHALKS